MSQRDTQGKKDKGRFSSKRKTEAVLRLLRGEDLDTLSRELGVTAASLSRWPEEFLAAGEVGLKGRTADGREQQIRELIAATTRGEHLARRLHQALEHISDAFFTLGEEWRFSFVNEATTRIVGRPQTELLAESIWECSGHLSSKDGRRLAAQ